MKQKVGKVLKFMYFFSCCFLVLSHHVYAYIDPSTVTYIIQGVAGVLIAIGAVVTICRHKIKAAWRKWYYGRAARKNQKKLKNIAKEDRKKA